MSRRRPAVADKGELNASNMDLTINGKQHKSLKLPSKDVDDDDFNLPAFQASPERRDPPVPGLVVVDSID